MCLAPDSFFKRSPFTLHSHGVGLDANVSPSPLNYGVKSDKINKIIQISVEAQSLDSTRQRDSGHALRLQHPLTQQPDALPMRMGAPGWIGSISFPDTCEPSGWPTSTFAGAPLCLPRPCPVAGGKRMCKPHRLHSSPSTSPHLTPPPHPTSPHVASTRPCHIPRPVSRVRTLLYTADTTVGG